MARRKRKRRRTSAVPNGDLDAGAAASVLRGQLEDLDLERDALVCDAARGILQRVHRPAKLALCQVPGLYDKIRQRRALRLELVDHQAQVERAAWLGLAKA